MKSRAVLIFVFVISLIGGSFAFGQTASVSLLNPTGRTVVQRSDLNQADILIAGAFTGSVDAVEVRAIPMSGASGTPSDWTTVSSFGGGAFEHSLTLAAGGWYQIEARGIFDSAVVGSDLVERVGVGEVFVMAGQSNSANYGVPQQTPGDRVSAFDYNAGVWQHAVDPQPTATGMGGSPWPILGDTLVGDLDMPVGIISVGVGGSAVGEWVPGNPSNYYQRLSTALNSLGSTGCRAVLWHQGETDAGSATSTADYAQRLESVIAQSRIDAGYDVNWGVALASYYGPDSIPANQVNVIAGQQQVIANDPLVFEGASTDDFHTMDYMADTVHFNDAGLHEHAARWADALNNEYYHVPEVHYTFRETSPGSWEVTIEIIGEGTAGLSAYEIWVDGVDPATVNFAENTLGTVVGGTLTPIGFLSSTFIQGEVVGNFNAGNYQSSGDSAIQGVGMVEVYEPGSIPGTTPLVDLGVPALLGILSTETGLTEANFRAIVVGLLNAAGDGFLSSPPIPTYEVIPFVLLAGDANRDGVVSAGDYASVQANFGGTGSAGIPGDANGDGVVSAADYASVQANFGNIAPPLTAVPEPATLSLLIIGGFAGLIRRRKKLF